MTTREPDSARDVRRPLVGESFALQGSAALNDIFRLQYDQFLRFSRIRIGNVPDAEDLVQDAFLSVRRAYPDKGIGVETAPVHRLAQSHAGLPQIGLCQAKAVVRRDRRSA